VFSPALCGTAEASYGATRTAYIASGGSPVALDFLKEVFYSMTTPVQGAVETPLGSIDIGLRYRVSQVLRAQVQLCGEWYSRSAVGATGMQVLTPLMAAVRLRAELS